MNTKKTLRMELIVLMMLGAVSIIEGVRLCVMEKLQLYDVLGPGLYNVGVGIILLIAASIYYIVHRRTVVPAETHPAGREYRVKMVSMILVMMIYIILMDVVGYLYSSLVFFFLMTRVVGMRPWRTNAILSIGLSVSFYIIFVRWLGMIFPQGRLLNF